MATPGTTSLRLTTGCAAVGLAALVAVVSAARPSDTPGAARALVGTGAVLALAAAVAARLPRAVAAGVALLGTEYAFSLAGRGGVVDFGAPVAAAALFLVAELAFWSAETSGVRTEGAVVGARATRLGVTTVVATAAAVVVVAAATLSGGGNVWLQGTGMVAALGVLAIAIVLTRRVR
jgi:hypothetical protein